MSLVLSNSHHHFQWGHHCRDDNHHQDHDDDNMFNVFLKMWDGKTLCCVINAHQAAIVHVVVHTLEKKVMEQYPTMNRKNFFFEVGGKPLSTTTNTTTACLLHNGSTVFVQYRNRGGCFMVSFTVMMTIFALILSSTCTCGTSLLLVPLLLPFLFVLPLFCL